MLNLKEEVESYPRTCGLIIVRGISGSGKTTFANKLRENLCVPVGNGFPILKFGADIFEADDYFKRVDGVYDFNVKLLKNAHESCFKRITHYLLFGRGFCSNYVGILSNTSTQIWEMQKYLDFAKDHNFPVKVYRMVSQYENTHGVPAEKVQQMKDRFEDFEGEILVDQYE